MYVEFHPAEIRVHGDDGYNPRDIRIRNFLPDLDVVEGFYRDDGPRPTHNRARPDVPFRFFIPRNAAYDRINAEIWRRLQTGRSLADLNFSAWRSTPSNPRYVGTLTFMSM